MARANSSNYDATRDVAGTGAGAAQSNAHLSRKFIAPPRFNFIASFKTLNNSRHKVTTASHIYSHAEYLLEPYR